MVVGPPPPVDLNAMLTTLEPAIRARVPERVSVRLSLLPEAWRCTFDRDTVSRLLLDLVGDASGDLEAGGDLIVGTRNYAFDAANVRDTPGARVGEFARITVRDSGRGLTNGALERVFDPSVTTRPAASAAWLLTRRLGGFTRVESAEGIGTAVHLYFPRAGEAPSPAVPPPGRKRYRASGGRSTQRRSRSLS
jgi:signal transduction histidine kinase